MEKKISSQYRIDENVFITMSLFAIVSVLILAFQFSTAEPCKPVNILVNASNFYEATLISFKAETKNGKTYKWNFGDDSKPEQAGFSVSHAFKKAGMYMVSVLVNGNCDAVTSVEIREAPIVINTNLQPEFVVPDSAFINQPVQFRDLTRDATAWEWSFGESNQIDAKIQEPVYTYYTAGIKEVLLKINRRPDQVAKRLIRVIDPKSIIKKKNVVVDKPYFPHIIIKEKPAGDSTAPPNPVAKDPVNKKPPPEITRDQVETFIRDVIAGDQSPADFSQSLCGNINLLVTFNNKEMPFHVMCKKLEKIRSRRVKGLDFTMKQENGCITGLDVVLKKTML